VSRGETTDIDRAVKLAIYRHFAATGERPQAGTIARSLDIPGDAVLAAYGRLRGQRVLVLEPDGASIRMAPPFSGVATQHVVEADGRSYFANCAWDAFGIPAALHRPAVVRSRCERSMEPLVLDLGPSGPPDSEWLFHCLVPAANWWDDIVFT
jgi:hypothetical protein